MFWSFVKTGPQLSIKGRSHYGKQYSSSSNLFKLLYDPAIPVLGQKTKQGHEEIFVHNSQKLEATQVPTDGWMDKQNNMTYTHNGTLFSLKKEGNWHMVH